MSKLIPAVAAAVFCAVLHADEYVYLITAPVATVCHTAVSAAAPLAFAGCAAGAAVALEQTDFTGWSRAASSASSLNTRKPTGIILLVK